MLCADSQLLHNLSFMNPAFSIGSNRAAHEGGGSDDSYSGTTVLTRRNESCQDRRTLLLQQLGSCLAMAAWL